MTREEVYEALDSERNYQAFRWGDREHSLEEWLVYMEDYMREMKTALSRNPDEIAYPMAAGIMRKITAMGVCAGEQHGFVKRSIVGDQIHNVKVVKLETRADAKHPQEEKYPSGELFAQGVMITPPVVGFTVRVGAMYTSTVEEILEIKPGEITFKTVNSVYKLTVMR